MGLELEGITGDAALDLTLIRVFAAMKI